MVPASLVATALTIAGLLAGTASADDSPAFDVLGPATREVRLVEGRGDVAVLVRNVSSSPVRPLVRFMPSGADQLFTLTRPKGDRTSPVTLSDAGQVVRSVEPGSTRRIEATLVQRSDETTEEAGGTLLIATRGDREPLEITLQGRPPDIRFEPATLSFDISQACWLVAGTCGDSAEIIVRGRDAQAWARHARGPLGTTILHNSHGGSLRVRLRDPAVREGTVTVVADAEDLSESGRYDGVVPLDASSISGVELRLEARVRWSLATAVLVVFVGALFGGFFLRRFEIRRQRGLLKLELQSALVRYDEARGTPPGPVFGYDLDALLEPRAYDRAATVPYPGIRGVSALLWHIETASDDADFSQDGERTRELIAEIERWLTLEPVARDATALLREAPPPPRGQADFSQCRCVQDLARLRLRAAQRPADDAVCEQIVAALAGQGLVVARAKVLWTMLAQLEARDGWRIDEAKTIHDLDLIALEGRYPTFDDRTSEQTDELRVELDDAIERLRRLQGNREPVTSGNVIVQARELEEDLNATRLNPAITRHLPEFTPWRLGLSAAFNRLALRSLIWTLARALVAVAAYAITVYSDTWGSVTDFASAFTVGFLTETLVNWALLPAFRSIRNRADAASLGAREVVVSRTPSSPATPGGNGQAASVGPN